MAKTEQSSTEDNVTNEALLTEYEVRQQHISASSQRGWQATGIMLAAALVGLFFVATSVSPRNLLGPILTTLLCGFVLVILVLWLKIVQREVFFQYVSIKRMREIEAKLGLRGNIYINIVDHWHEREKNPYWAILSDNEKSNLEKNYARRRKGKACDAPRPTTPTATYWIGALVMGGWVVLTILEWFSYVGWIN